jgi:hypothetical protein
VLVLVVVLLDVLDVLDVVELVEAVVPGSEVGPVPPPVPPPPVGSSAPPPDPDGESWHTLDVEVRLSLLDMQLKVSLRL